MVESNLVDPSAPANLPFAVKTPSQQLADQAQVASLPDATTDAGWTINLGDFATKKDAQARLQQLRKSVPTVLEGKTAQTVVVDKNGQITYRARFSGFDQSAAGEAFKVIKKKKSLCSVQAAS